MIHSILFLLISVAPTTNVVNGIVLISDVEFAKASEHQTLTKDLYMDVAFPAESNKLLPAVIFVHGGGWAKGKRQDGLNAIKMVANGGYFAATIDYRLMSDGGFPNAVHDCKAAIKFLRKNAETLSIDPERIAISGLSAGGHLAALVGLSTGDSYLDGEINGDTVSTKVVCIGSISGTMMPQLAKGRGKKIYEQWALKDSSIQLSQTLPHTYLDSNDPPIYLLCGSDDYVCPVEYTEQFVAKLQLEDVEYQIEVLPKKGHIFTEPECFLGLLGFFDQHLGGNARNAMEKQISTSSRSGRSGK